MDRFWIDADWKAAMEQAGLTNLVLLLMYTEGKCLSMHSRGSTFRTTLPGGQTVFIKRDHYTMLKDVNAQLMRLQWPAPKSIREWHVLTRLKNLGFNVPRVIAAGSRTKLGLPTVAGIVMLPIPGMSLEDFLREQHSVDQRKRAIGLALQELERLQNAGVNWPDCKPEHFFITPQGTVALLDLERAGFQCPPLPDSLKQRQRDFFRKRLPKDMAELMQ